MQSNDIDDQRLSSTQLSVAILAGGHSMRMQGKDKAFLSLNGLPFIRLISNQMLQVSDDVLVLIGSKDEKRFTDNVSENVIVAKDRYNFGTPVSGMLTACELVKNLYIAFVGCDMPLVRAGVIKYLHERALGHSAAVPMWESGETEPLCSVIISKSSSATLQAERQNAKGCKKVIEYLQDVSFVPASDRRIALCSSHLETSTPGRT